MIKDRTIPSTEKRGKGELLVVDDEAINREMLKALLTADGYEVHEAADGQEALEVVGRRRPDCILLDLSMPRLGGVEVCREVKAAPATRMIPVIVITANQDSQSRLDAISAGADDFLTKPYVPEEVRLRVRNAVGTKHLYDRSQDDLRRLQSLEATKDTLTHMLIHDLKQPLTAIKAYGDLLAMRLEAKGDEENLGVARKVGGFVDSTVSMISLILDIARLEEGKLPLQLSKLDLAQLLETAVDASTSVAATRSIRLELVTGAVEVTGDHDLVVRIAENLLSNAVKYSPDGAMVKVATVEKADSAGFTVTDHGPGIPREYHTLIFEKFGQVEMGDNRKKYSSGLGLAFCRLAAEAHGGTIEIESAPGLGATFTVLLPR